MLIPCQLGDSFGLSLALVHDNTGEILTVALLVLRLENCRSIVATCLIAGRLLELALQELTFRVIHCVLLLKIVACLVCENFRSILG